MQSSKGFALIPMLVALQVLALAYIAVLEGWLLDNSALQQMQGYLQRQAEGKQCIAQAIAALPAQSACLRVQRQFEGANAEHYWELAIEQPMMRVFVRCTADCAQKNIVGWQMGGSLF